jgi:hypothetical protein
VLDLERLKTKLGTCRIPGSDFWFEWIDHIKATDVKAQEILDFYKLAILSSPEYVLVKSMIDFAVEEHEEEKLVSEVASIDIGADHGVCIISEFSDVQGTFRIRTAGLWQ